MSANAAEDRDDAPEARLVVNFRFISALADSAPVAIYHANTDTLSNSAYLLCKIERRLDAVLFLATDLRRDWP